jgi:hypothetical protein
VKDKHGNLVELGDVVRVLEICQDYLNILLDDEKPYVMEMLNNEFSIDDFPEEGKVSVSKVWDIGDGMSFHSGIYMMQHEFELVRKAHKES